jgi:hypothetical protein
MFLKEQQAVVGLLPARDTTGAKKINHYNTVI